MTPGVRWFAATTRVIAANEPLPIERVNELAYAARVAAFENIQACLKASGNTLDVPAAPYFMASSRSRAPISTPMDTCSAAFARTAVALGMQEEVLPGARPVSARSPLYNEWLPMYEELVQRVAEQHGGRVTLESEPDRGTRVQLRLPRHAGAPAHA